MNALLQGVMSGMLDWLAVGDSTRALNRVTGTNFERNREIFETLIQGGENLALRSEFGTLRETVLGEDLSEFFLQRESAEGTAGFWIYLIRGRDGIWRIDEM